MNAENIPALKNRVLHFLKQDAGFEDTPKVNIVISKTGYHVNYNNISTKITGFGEDENNAFFDFVDKWERAHHNHLNTY